LSLIVTRVTRLKEEAMNDTNYRHRSIQQSIDNDASICLTGFPISSYYKLDYDPQKTKFGQYSFYRMAAKQLEYLAVYGRASMGS